MMKSLLIANRGEIACRIIRTARRMGVRTVAVFSDADRHAMHVREADEAVHIGPSPARESYLVGEKIIAAARKTGAEAIHPGYGFLSENADFAQAVIEAGLVWVGPRPESIRAMGLKDAAKKLMAEAGVPVTPGYLGEDQAPERLQKEADSVGYPVLIKAVAGGGGKGMRRVNASAEFEDMLQSCKREALSSFGDDRVLIEKYVERPRHIEVQVFGDSHGNAVHLFERDCSLQRRHQKVIEEAPAPGMDEATRAAVCEAAVKAAKAVDYVGAGTVEFIADASEGLRADRIWFMEMNTRLQVEHPVTEAITGQDLVKWQLLVAAGWPLPLKQEELSIDGWAMEARLYAENPSSGFLPSTGRLEHFVLDKERARIDAGVARGDDVTPYYDPMIAKLICHAPTRNRAISVLAGTLDRVQVWPVRTNAGFLLNAVLHPEFTEGEVDTGFVARCIDRLAPKAEPHKNVWRSAAREMREKARRREAASLPWNSLDGFRSNSAPDGRVTLAHEGEMRTVDLGDGQPFAIAGKAWLGDRLIMFFLGDAFAFDPPGAAGAAAGGAAADGTLLSPMPGRVISVEVRQGDRVTKGRKLLTLEAMKMEHSLVAPFDGIVAELNAAQGAQVSEGMLLVRVEKKEG
jgi:3-methylcrotonyl-CoA carboxylase alpha subunit